MEELYECSAQYGAGVLYPCHADCQQYGKCPAPPVALPLPLQSLPTAVAIQRATPQVQDVVPEIITVEKLIQPVPDIVALQVPMVVGECDGDWAGLNAAINASPMCALMVLGAGILVLAAIKGGK